MKIKLFVILIIFFCSYLYSITGIPAGPGPPRPYDFIRGAAGNRLFYDNTENAEKTFFIANDFRILDFKRFWNDSNKINELDISYLRIVNVLSFYYKIKKLRLSLRFPFIWTKQYDLVDSKLEGIEAKKRAIENYEYNYIKYGISDIYIGIQYNIINFDNIINMYLACDVRTPINGTYESNYYPGNEGISDFIIVLKNDLHVNKFYTSLDIGYCFIKNEKYFNSEKDGNGIFIDIAALREFIKGLSGIIEFNYYYLKFQNGSLFLNELQYKLGIVPGFIYNFKDILKTQIGFSLDILGKNALYGMGPVIRFKIYI